MEWYIGVLKQYAVFTGRARRQEYWMFILFNLIIVFAISFVEGLVFDTTIIGSLYSLAVFIPSLAVGTRRLHDMGRTGWWLLIGIIPIIGFLVLVYFMVQASQEGDNEYGQNPKLEA